MMRKSAVIAAVVAAVAFAGTARAADKWFELGDFGPVTQRVAVTVENPASVDNPAGLVHIPMGDLRKVLPGAGMDRVCVVDPETKPAGRAAADENFVPFQVSQRTLIFALPLKAGEKKTVYVYTAPEPLNMPGFVSGTAWDNRHAYRSFENKYAAFRMETGPGANTTGMSIDAFGKTKAGVGLRLVELYGTGHDSYHKLNAWGVDILKVGSGPGLGGVYVYSGDKEGRPAAKDILANCLYQGPVETKIRFTAPVKVGDREVTVQRDLTLVAEDRAILDEVTIQGGNLEGLRVGVGVRDLPNCVWVEKAEKGYGFQTGDANQPNYKAVGLGATFDPKAFVKVIDLPDKNNGGHVYVLNPTKAENALVSRHRLYDIWDMDGQLPGGPVEKAEQLRGPFEKWLAAGAELGVKPVKVTVGEKAESK